MSITTTTVKACDNCQSVQVSSEGWTSWKMMNVTNPLGLSVDFCPVCIAALGQKDLLKTCIEANSHIQGLPV